MGRALFDISWQFWGDESLQAKKTKAKIIKCNLIKLRSFYIAKKTTKKKKKKRQPCKLGNICKWYDQKRVNVQNISKACTNQHQKTKALLKLAKDLKRHFSKENIQMTNRHMKKKMLKIIFREMQIKIIMS